MVSVYGQEKYLVMQDIDLNRVLDVLPTSEVLCDVACLVYDASDPKSFEFVARTYLNYYSTLKIPVLIVANKTDLGKEVLQDYIQQPIGFCSKHKLPPPHNYTSLTGNKEIYVKLATMAAFPRFQAAWMVFYRNSHLHSLLDPGTYLQPGWLKAGLGLALVGSLAYILYKVVPSSGGAGNYRNRIINATNSLLK